MKGRREQECQELLRGQEGQGLQTILRVLKQDDPAQP